MDLLYGAGRLDRTVRDAERHLVAYRADPGYRYMLHRPATDPDRLAPEDVAVTLLVNSRAGAMAILSVADRGPRLDLRSLPDRPLEATDRLDRRQLAEFLAGIAAWPGFGASLATKLLHKKRPHLIPILDNQAIFGAYMYPDWPAKPSRQDTIKAAFRIEEALDWIATDLTRSENAATWRGLQTLEPDRPLVEIFDMVWWMSFRLQEPVAKRMLP